MLLYHVIFLITLWLGPIVTAMETGQTLATPKQGHSDTTLKFKQSEPSLVLGQTDIVLASGHSRNVILAGHPVHVCITSVELGREKAEVTVSHRFFTDDFSLLFYHLFERNIKPVEGSDISEPDLQIIKQYMEQVFSVFTDQDERLAFEYTGKDQNEDSIWLHFKGTIPDDFKGKLSVKNMIMLDLYEDQTNLVIVAVDGKEQGYRFDYTNIEETVDLQDGL